MTNSETDPAYDVQRVTAVALAGEFRPIRVLSRGGVGAILLAEEVVTRRRVALKVLNPETKCVLPLAQQFMREAVITARLQHPNIVPVYRLGFLDGERRHPHLFFTMKFIEGSSYAIVRHRLRLEDRLGALAGVAAALAYAHSRKLWHRDLKPDNVMLGLYDDVYLVDWGLVSIAPGTGYRLDLPEVAMLDLVQTLPETIDTLLEETPEAVTVTGAVGPNKVLGTPLYMSPEQAADHRDVMGPPSDVWALGVMLFEALCDMHPYVDDPSASSLEILTSTLGASIPPISRVAPSAPPQLAALCDAMLARDLAQRPLASEVLEVLRAPFGPRRHASAGTTGDVARPATNVAVHEDPPSLLPTSKTLVADRSAKTVAWSALPLEPPQPPSSPTPSTGCPGLLPDSPTGIPTRSPGPPPDLHRRSAAPENPAPDAAHRGISIVSPTGYRIEGVSFEEALILLKQLGGCA